MPSSNGLSQRSILSLDKSDAPFSILIDEACEFLDIQLEENSITLLYDDKDDPRKLGSDPRVDWALRWLLKNLQTTEVRSGRYESRSASEFSVEGWADGYSPCLDYRAWLLVRELVLRTPLATVARLLSAHKFTVIVRATLQWLAQKSVHMDELDTLDGDSASADPMSANSSLAGSSATVQGASPNGAAKVSRKRKRDGTVEEPIAQTHRDIARLYTSICCNLIQLQKIAGDKSRGYAVEQLLAALRSPFDDAAAILGCSARVVDYLVRHEELIPSLNYDHAWLLPMVQHWRSQMTCPEDDLNFPASVAFSKHCLVPILYLVWTYNAWVVARAHKYQILKMLEDLLLTHFLQPAQKSYLNSLRPRDSRSRDIPAELTQILLAPLIRDFGLKGKTRQYALYSATHLFSIAAHESRNPSPSKRRNRDTWLHHLFCQIVENAGTFDYKPNNDPETMLLTFTRTVLETAAQVLVQLEPITLEKILRPLLVADGAFQDVEWNVLSLCMELDATIFVGSPEDMLVNGQVLKNECSVLLQLLFTKMNQIGWKATTVGKKLDPRSPDDSIYKSLFAKILAPLASAFIQVRDFPRFFTIWQQELCQHYLDRGYEDVMSIWEDNELVYTIARLVESDLPVEKADILLNRAVKALECLLGMSSFELDGPDKEVALLVTLECWLLGCTSNRNLKELEKRVLEIYQLLLRLMGDDRERPKKCDTRCWRVLALISDKWSLSPHSLELHQSALQKAFLTINRVSVVQVQRYDYSQELGAFRFALSLAEAENAKLDGFLTGNPQGERVGRIEDAIEVILDHSNSRRDLDPLFFLNVEWSGVDEFIVTGTDFSLACCAQLVAVPRTLGLISKRLQFRVFEDLYQPAFAELYKILFERQPLDLTPDAFIENFQFEVGRASYLKLWERLSSSIMLDDQAAVSARFGDFQVSKYLHHSNSELERQEVNANNHDVALDLLLLTPLHLFTKTQKINVSNRLVQVLADMAVGRRSIAKALHLLLSLAKPPSRSMVLFNKPNLLSGESGSGDRRHSTTWIFEIARWLDEDTGVDGVDVAAIIQLKQLAMNVMQYLCSISTRNSSIGYMETICQQIDQKLGGGLRDRGQVATSTLIGACLNFMVSNRNRLPGPRPETTVVNTWRSRHLDYMLEAKKAFEGKEFVERNERKILQTIMDAIDSHTALAVIGPAMDQAGSQIHVHQIQPDHKDPTPVLNVGKYSTGIFLTQAIRSLQLHKPENKRLVNAALGAIQHLVAPSDKEYLLKTFQALAARRDPCELLYLLYDMLLCETEEKGDEIAPAARDFGLLRLLERVLICLDGSQRPPGALASRLAETFSRLCELLYKPLDSHACVQALRCMSLLLRYQKYIISQFHIDSIMSTITAKSTSLYHQPDKIDAGTTFLGLCRIFETTLIMHRKKLGGRYHLVIPALQHLLQCLFVPYEDVGQSLHKAEEEMLYAGYGEAQATAYAHLLTTLCDPTVSAVSRSRRTPRQELNDETQKARRIAGQHLQYVVEEFCGCQLEGRLLPGMRTALNPGLWAIFDVMTQEVMRNLNAAMDPSSRSVFKALYDDYQRSGRWRSGDGRQWRLKSR